MRTHLTWVFGAGHSITNIGLRKYCWKLGPPMAVADVLAKRLDQCLRGVDDVPSTLDDFVVHPRTFLRYLCHLKFARAAPRQREGPCPEWLKGRNHSNVNPSYRQLSQANGNQGEAHTMCNGQSCQSISVWTRACNEVFLRQTDTPSAMKPALIKC